MKNKSYGSKPASSRPNSSKLASSSSSSSSEPIIDLEDDNGDDYFRMFKPIKR